MNELGKLLLAIGAAVFVVGLVILVLPRLGLNIGRLPGDWEFSSGNLTCLVPLGTSIVLSILLTIGLNLLARFLNR
jgi:hypothetical protein